MIDSPRWRLARRAGHVGLAASALAAAAWLLGSVPTSNAQQAAPLDGDAARLAATPHPPLPSEAGRVWFAPAAQGSRVAPALQDFARGVKLLENADANGALPLVSQGALASTPMADYARYYTGVAQAALMRPDEAEASFAAVAARTPAGRLAEDVTLRRAEIRTLKSDHLAAAALYDQLARSGTAQPALVWLRLGQAREATQDGAAALEAYRRAYYDYPLSPEAGDAESALARMDALDTGVEGRMAHELKRAQVLYDARRWTEARETYARIRRKGTTEAERAFGAVREAACDVQLKRYRPTRDVLKGLAAGPAAAEAEFHLLAATRGLGHRDDYVQMTRAFVDAHPGSPLAEEALNNLATHYILIDEDARAEEVFVEMLDRVPQGRFTERAAWRAGWWAYRTQRYADTVRIFERAAAAFPRSDYRPPWLYWTAKAHDQLGAAATATERYRLVATDYLNSYYGRLAWTALETRKEASVNALVARTAPGAPAPPNEPQIAQLIALELFQDAIAEVRYAQRAYGDSPALQATLALAQNRAGNLRTGINAMKRAYPQYLAAGGEKLPAEVLKVLFPVDFWPLLQQQAAQHGLDPYVVAALVAQESTFDPVIVSSAKAIGLMQVLPSTGRQYARRLGIKPFSASRLTDPNVNVRIGTQYFADLVDRFGAAHFALASYNAGENKVSRWQSEKPGLPQDEFIDDIPYPETQNYVKRILGTAEDYRRLYGGGAVPDVVVRKAAVKKSPTAVKKKAPARKKAPAKKPPTKKTPTTKTGA
jgi:soluble lytic murein transglycosylase